MQIKSMNVMSFLLLRSTSKVLGKLIEQWHPKILKWNSLGVVAVSSLSEDETKGDSLFAVSLQPVHLHVSLQWFCFNAGGV